MDTIGEILTIIFRSEADTLELCRDLINSSFSCIGDKLLAQDSASLTIPIGRKANQFVGAIRKTLIVSSNTFKKGSKVII